MIDIAEKIFQAIEIISKKQLETLSFDKTIEATIVDASKSSDGIYTVSNGSTKFIAYSENTEYQEDDSVMVTIPQGDYDKQKIIVGKCVNNTNSFITYQSPFQQLIDVSNNLIEQNISVSMWANGDDYQWDINTENFIDSKVFSKVEKSQGYYIQPYKIWESNDNILKFYKSKYTRIGLKAQFATWLKEYNAIYGNYGLALVLQFAPPGDVSGKNTFLQPYIFDSKNFFGDIYNFETYFTQEAIFDISNFVDYELQKIYLYAYQRNNFADAFGERVPFKNNDIFLGNQVQPNIFIKDCYICLGTPIADFKTDSAELIIEPNDIFYKNGTEKNSNFIKTLQDKYISQFKILLNNYIKNTIDNEQYITAINTLNQEFQNLNNIQINEKNISLEELNNYKSDYINTIIELINSNDEQLQNQLNEISVNYYEKELNYIYTLYKENLNLIRTKENKKEITLRWIHKDEKTQVISLVEEKEIPTNYQIFWYRYKLGAPSPDEFVGAHWERFYGCNNTPDENLDYGISQEEYNNNHSLDIATNNIKIDFYPNVNRNNEQICAVIVKLEENANNFTENKNQETYRLIAKTNIIELKNNNEIRNEATFIDTNALSIRFDDETNGNYFYYNRAGKILKNEDSQLLRTLTAVYDENIENNDVYKKNILTEPYDYIKWSFPKENSMIIPAVNINSNTVQPISDNDIFKEGNTVAFNEDGEKITTLTGLYYKIIDNKDTYDLIFERPSNINGEILQKVGYFIQPDLKKGTKRENVSLEVHKDGQIFTSSVIMSFGSFGTSGSDYTITLSWNNDNAFNVTEDSNYSLNGEIKLLNSAGEEVDLKQTDQAKFLISWYKIKSNNNSTQTTIKETRSIYYPIIDNNTTLKKLKDNFNREIDIYSIKKDDVNNYYYRYNLSNNNFIQEDNYNSSKIQYGKLKESSEKKEKIEFITVDETINTGIHESLRGKYFYDNNQKLCYYYSKTRRAFVKHDGVFIIDPWEDYSDIEQYYIPILSSEKQYSSNALIIQQSEENSKYFSIKKQNNSTVSMDDLYILQITLKDFGDSILTAYFPMPLKADIKEFNNGIMEKVATVKFIDGPDTIRYTSSGEIDFKKDIYQIQMLVKKDNKWITKKQGYDENSIIGYWTRIYDTSNNLDNSILLPVLKETSNHINPNGKINPILVPPNIYFSNFPLFGIQFFYKTKNDLYICVWTQPIYIYQDNYFSTTLNQWNGKDITTNNETGIISANGFSAGKKETDNSFTGVVIGDWSKTDIDVMTMKQTGVYGFNHGEMSYALKDDGTAFFGKSGRGRIFFDGNSAKIYSGSWINSNLLNQNNNQYQQNNTGMMLDIDDGKIELRDTNIMKTIITPNEFRIVGPYEYGPNQMEDDIFKISRINVDDNYSNKVNYVLKSVGYNENLSDPLHYGVGLKINFNINGENKSRIDSHGDIRLFLSKNISENSPSSAAQKGAQLLLGTHMGNNSDIQECALYLYTANVDNSYIRMKWNGDFEMYNGNFSFNGNGSFKFKGYDLSLQNITVDGTTFTILGKKWE